MSSLSMSEPTGVSKVRDLLPPTIWPLAVVTKAIVPELTPPIRTPGSPGVRAMTNGVWNVSVAARAVAAGDRLGTLTELRVRRDCEGVRDGRVQEDAEQRRGR